jgi:biotin synthase-like enzyme
MLWTRKAGVLLTLEDTVEFFNLIDGTKLTPQEKQDLVAFLRALCSRRRCPPKTAVRLHPESSGPGRLHRTTPVAKSHNLR